MAFIGGGFGPYYGAGSAYGGFGSSYGGWGLGVDPMMADPWAMGPSMAPLSDPAFQGPVEGCLGCGCVGSACSGYGCSGYGCGIDSGDLGMPYDPSSLSMYNDPYIGMEASMMPPYEFSAMLDSPQGVYSPVLGAGFGGYGSYGYGNMMSSVPGVV